MEDGSTNSEGNLDISGFGSGDNNPGIEVINCIVHDCGNGGMGGSALIYYGCLIYNNGFYSADTNSFRKPVAAGCGFYVQNKDTNLYPIFKNTVACDNAKWGFQGNSATGTNVLINLWLDGITCYQNGHLAGLQANGLSDDEAGVDLVFADQKNDDHPWPISNCGIVNSCFWNLEQTNARNWQLLDVPGVTIQGSFYWTNCIFALQNLVTDQWGYVQTFYSHLPTNGAIVFSNQFYGGICETNAMYPYNNLTNQFPTNTYGYLPPTNGQQIIVQTNVYEAGRGNIIICNWGKSDTIVVSNLANIGLTSGQSYELHQCQDYYGDVTNLTFNGSSITIQMTNHSVAKPVGINFHKAPTSFPQFGAFIIRKAQ
jgi:hypothetical protein